MCMKVNCMHAMHIDFSEYIVQDKEQSILNWNTGTGFVIQCISAPINTGIMFDTPKLEQYIKARGINLMYNPSVRSKDPKQFMPLLEVFLPTAEWYRDTGRLQRLQKTKWTKSPPPWHQTEWCIRKQIWVVISVCVSICVHVCMREREDGDSERQMASRQWANKQGVRTSS